jgi:hypothetical protein
MYFLYRISNNSYRKDRLPNGTKENCFRNFLSGLLAPEDTLIVVADNVNQDLNQFLEEHLPSNGKLLRVSAGSNAASFKLQLELAKEIPQDEIVFLHEDDYLYQTTPDPLAARQLNNRLVHEGLERADYVSLYDHPDKYMPPSQGGNPLVSKEGVEVTGIFLTHSSHWKYTNSTTLTFAARASTLVADTPLWNKLAPADFKAFMKLRRRGRKLATPIPGRSTHAETQWQTPLYDWASLSG